MILEALISVALIILVLWFVFDGRKNPKAPPGPLKLPVIGNLIQIALAHAIPYLGFHKLSQKYGPVMSLKVGSSDIVLLSSYDSMKDILAREEAAGRDLSDIIQERADRKNLGIIFSVGETWRIMRPYTISTLKVYGYGNRNSTECLISDEVQNFSEHLKNKMKENNGIVDCRHLFHVTVLNVLWTYIGGRKLNYTDRKINYLIETAEEIKTVAVMGAGLLAAFPILKHIAPGPTGFTLHKKICTNWRVFFQELLDEYREVYTKTKEVNCYIDAFLEKIEENSNDPNTLFTDEQFVMCALDLFQAGSETTAGNLNFAILFMVLRPDIQKKFHEEIDRVIGKSRHPELTDRINMPYAQAIILEVFRWARITVTLVPRKATKDIFYKNWTIKEGTAIYVNTHSIYFDEDFWGDPHVFRPERFLDGNNKIISEIAERIVVFGSGKRICPGEGLARDTFFLFLTNLLQMFSFEMVPGDEKPSTEPVLGFVLSTPPYRALLKERLTL